MNSHPDADGFLRAILAAPADPTPRLIFADWLDDTGRPGNAAWAEYIRARAAGDDRAAATVGRRVVARLTLPADGFPARAADLFDLIPPYRIRLRLDMTVGRHLFELVPESIARENVLAPLTVLFGPAFPDPTLLVVAEHPEYQEMSRRLEWVTDRPVVVVGADPAEIRDLINWAYGETDWVTLDTQPLPPLPEYDDSDIELHRRQADWT